MNFYCDTTVQPTLCKSQAMLYFKIFSIIKGLSTNSAVIAFDLKNPSNLPFPIKR
jgi:hypothetical protein